MLPILLPEDQEPQKASTLGGGMPLLLPDTPLPVPAETIRQNLHFTQGVNPDQVAEDHRLGQASGFPTGLVSRNRDEIRARVEKTAVLDKIASYPATQQFLTDQHNMAVSKDDIDNLTKIEQKIIDARPPAGIGEAAWGGLKQVIPRINQGLAEKGDILWNMTGYASAFNSLANLAEMEGKKEWAATLRNISNAPKDSANAWKAQADSVTAPTASRTLPDYVQQAVTSIGTSLSAAPFGIAGEAYALGMFALTSVGGYQEMKGAGVNPILSGALSLSNSAMEGLTEKMGLDVLYKGGKPLVKKMTEFLFKDLAGEELNTLYNAVVDKVTVRPDMSLADLGGQIVDTAIVTALAGGAQGATFHGASKAHNSLFGYLNDRKIAATQEQQQKIIESLTMAESSKLYLRAPELLGEFIQRAAEHHGGGTVYLQADRVLEEAHKAGVQPEELPRWLDKYGVKQEDFSTALVSGGNIELEVGKVATGLKEDAILSALQSDMRVAQGGYSAANVESQAGAEQGHFTRLNDLFNQEQNLIIQPEDMDSWEESILAQEGLRGRVKKESLLPLVARANMLGKLTGGPAIEHLNRMLGPTGLRAMKLKDFQNNGDNSIFQADELGRKADESLGALSQENGRNIVSLFEKADKSTFLHETGHIFINDLKFMAETHGVQSAEWEATRQWLGVGEDGTLTKAMHEKFAEHFEAYLMEGKAPTLELRNAFRTFKRWLIGIYETMKSKRFGQRGNIELSPEVTGIFDRMLATDQEIQQAKEQAALIGMLDHELLNNTGFSKEQIDEYRQIAQQADNSAREKRDQHKLSGLQERLKAWRTQAEEESKKVPVYGITDALSRNAAGGYGKGAGLSRQSIIDVFGDVKLPDLPALWRKEGMDIRQAIAEHGEKFGYETMADLVADLEKMQPRQQWVDKRVAQLEAEHTLSHDTTEAIRTASLRKMLEIESHWLEKQLEREQAKAEKGKVGEAFKAAKANAIPQKIMREWADKVVSGRTLRQIGNLTGMLTESRRHRQQAITLAKKGDWAGALKSNEQARLTEELIAASYRAKNQWAKMSTSWKKIAKWTNDNKAVKIGEDFRDQINRILSSYSGVVAGAEFNPQARDLHSFVAEMAANDEFGLGTALPEWIGVETGSAFNLPWEKLQDLDSALKFLYGHGREQIEGLRTTKGEFIKDIATEIIGTQSGLKGDKLKKLRDESTATSRIIRGIQKKNRKFFAHTGILSFMGVRMDGLNNVGGKGKRGRAEGLIVDIRNGMAKGNDMFSEIGKEVEPCIDQLSKGKDKIFTDIELPDLFKRHGLTWTKERVVAACLNMGNAGNMQRLMDGYGIDDTTIRVLKSKLTAADWEAINRIWKAVDSLWPQIAEVHKRLNYFTPKKVTAVPFTVRTEDGQTVELTGGYYPAAYDKSLDREIAGWGEKEDILASNAAVLQKPVAKSGFAKGRMTTVSRPLNLSLSVLGQHFNDTVRYITQAEAVRDADRVFSNAALANRNEETIGKELHEMIRPALKNIIRPVASKNGFFERSRVLMSTYYLAHNAWTAIQNVTGVFPAIRQTGMANYLSGIAHIIGGPLKAQRAMLEASSYMRLREGNIERDMQKQIRGFQVGGFKVKDKRYTFSDVQSLGFAGVRFIDSVVSLPAWWGKYNAEMGKHGDMKLAIEMADSAVNKALGSGLSIDSTGIGRHDFFSLLSPFMSFSSTQQEVLATEHEAWKNGKMATADYLYGRLMVWLLPSMFSTLLQGVLMYGIAGALGGGDDDSEGKTASDYITDAVSYRMMGIPFARDAVNAIIQGVEGKPGSGARMPATEFWSMILKTGNRAGNAFDSDSEKSIGALGWALSDVASAAAGIPASQIYRRWTKGTKQIEEGDGWWGNHFIPQENKKQ